ncbi:ligand-dependent nuclear receptor-interacting factor 1 isoform X2 [Osmerus eperlanus]|uniref:ligand-dependent nuclear receptor-interacting factor 1 isoform X2 n=1 Tax=Osmerus eperlanus TaxID=29151 RepID=UPI002E1569F2
MLTARNGTGVFYQAMPAVGADGRNVMQLIPVQKINGQFVPSQTSLPAVQTVEPQRAVVMNFASAPIVRNMSTIQPSNNGVKKQQFNIPGTPNPGQGLGRGHRVDVSQQNSLKQSHASLKPSSAPQVVSPVTHSPKSGTALSLMNTNKMPVTVKSPVLPNGQYLQIPPNAKVKTLPMSALPPGIKKQLFTSAANSPTVLYVSPVTTMNQGSLQPCQTVASSPSTPQKTSEQTPSVSSSMPSKRLPRTVAKDGSKPVTPIRWIIEEQDGSPAPCLVPVNPSVMASEILKTVAEREKTSKVQEVTAENPLTLKTQAKAGEVRDNALVMCNGKVYFVAKKTPELCKLMAKPLGAIGSLSEKAIGRGRSSQGRSFLPSLLLNPSIESQASDKNKSHSNSIVIPDGPDEVIDLCDDDSQDDPTLQAEPTAKLTETDKSRPVTHEDEDSNVIFVSYIPPKPVFRFRLHQMKRDPGNKLKAGLESVTSQNTVGEQNVIDTQSSVNVWSEGSCTDIDMTQDVPISTVHATDQELNTSLDNIVGQRMNTCRGTLSSMEVKDSLATDQAVKVLADPSVKETVTSQHVDITPKIAENRAVPSDQQEARNEQPAITSITDQAVKVLADPSVKETVTLQDVDITPEMEKNRAVPSDHQEARNEQPAITSITDQAVKLLADPSVKETVTSQDVDITPEMEENRAVPSDQQQARNKQPSVTSITDQAVKVLADPSVKVTVTSQDVDITPEMAENRAVLSDQQKARNKQPAVASITDQAVKVLADPSVKVTVTSQDVDITPEMAENRAVLSDQQEARNKQPAVASITDQAVKVLADPSVKETVTSQDVDITLEMAENMTVPSDQQKTMNEQPDVTSKDMDSANSNASIQAEKDTNQNQSGLKRMFGITSDVKIILKRIDDVQPEIPPKVLPQIGPISKSALEGIRKLIQGSQINLNKRKHDKTQGCPQESSDECPKDSKMQKTENAQIASPDSDNTKEALISSSPIPNACVVNVSEGSEQKSPCEDIAMASVEPQCLSTVRETCQSSSREISAVDLYSTTPMDPDEIKRHEKIRRLKELLREKEAALEMLRKNID